ncbi:unnamed protein product [Symbiodinium sp. KB8]|nr:unnamed protein product [Symbiodinium sp. KB8]
MSGDGAVCGPAPTHKARDGDAFLGFESNGRPNAPEAPPETSLGRGNDPQARRDAQHQHDDSAEKPRPGAMAGIATNWARRSSWDDTTGSDSWATRRPEGGQNRATVGANLDKVPGQMVKPEAAPAAIRKTIEDSGAVELQVMTQVWHGTAVPTTTTAASRTTPGVTGGTRASEKLAVPVFSGDTEDLGGSARSHLGQIEAWRRLTLLLISQQGLVLFQNLSGKAWIAAKELSDAVGATFLDLEVARIGRAFSDLFRRLWRHCFMTEGIVSHGKLEEADGEAHDDAELEDAVPERVAPAFATYQSAKDKYKDHV